MSGDAGQGENANQRSEAAKRMHRPSSSLVQLGPSTQAQRSTQRETLDTSARSIADFPASPASPRRRRPWGVNPIMAASPFRAASSKGLLLETSRLTSSCHHLTMRRMASRSLRLSSPRLPDHRPSIRQRWNIPPSRIDARALALLNGRNLLPETHCRQIKDKGPQ